MGFNTSFIDRHNCARALDLLSINAETPDYPKLCTCPICGKYELYIFADFELNSFWLACNACKTHGDVLAFAANLWNTSLPDTAEKFIEFELITSTEVAKQLPEYMRNYTRRQAAEEFWHSAKTQLWRHEDDIVACQIRELGLRAENSACYGIVGVSHHDQIAAICSTLGKPAPNKGRRDGAFIVFPFYELPEKLNGFLLLQHNKQLEMRFQFLPISQLKVRKPEAGYFLFDGVQVAPDQTFKNTLVITDNLFWALKAQTAHIETGTQFLPLVVSYSGACGESYGITWRHYPGKIKIFHAHTPTPELISRACNASGYTSFAPVEKLGGAQGLVSIRKAAKTWTHSLKTTLKELPEANAAAFISQLSVPKDKTFEFVARFDHSFSPAFASKVLANVATKQCVLSPRKQIIEKLDGWWSITGQKIINVCPQITTVVYDEHGEKMYCGRVVTEQNNSYEFQANGKLVEKAGLFTYVANVLAGYGETVVYERTWNKRGLHFALTLHPPKIVTVNSRYGWDEHNHVFRFADYEITAQGTTQKTIRWSQRAKTATFAEPKNIASIRLGGLNTPAHENSLVWLTVAAVLENLLAPVFDQQVSGTVITERNFDGAQQILQLCTCPAEQTTAATKKAAARFLQPFKKEMPWPTLVYNAFGDEQLSNIISNYFNRPLFARLTPQCAMIAPSYGWRSILSAGQQTELYELKDVIPAFICHALTTNFNPPTGALFSAILTELHRWLANFTGSSFNIEHANANVRLPDKAHETLIEAVGEAVDNKKIAILPQPRKRNQIGNYLLQRHDTVWLNKFAITRYFELAKAPGPNWHHIIKLLKQHNLYLGEEVVYEFGGFIVPANWFFDSAKPAQRIRATG